jgi:beta-glucosidase
MICRQAENKLFRYPVPIRSVIFIGLFLVPAGMLPAQIYPFQDPGMPVEQRIDNIISLMTREEKIKCLSTDTGVPRLGIAGSRQVEGLHGLAKGGPSNWGQIDPVPTTIFPQAIGLAETWDPEAVERVAAIEGYEARYIFQSPKYKKGGIVIRAPNADLGRDPRWGRTEECYGEDAWFNGVMTAAFVRGLQGDNPLYWQAAALMKHFLANSNENGREHTSSDFDEQLLREYYAYPFQQGVTAGSRAFMAAYNAHNGIPMTVHPMLRDMAVKEWGQDGIICTDGGGFGLLVSAHKYYPDLSNAAAACLRAGISQFLDRAYREGVEGALNQGLITESTIDSVLRGNFRVMIKLGLLDPPDLVPYSSIGIADTTDPWMTGENRDAAREITRESIVLLKNSDNFLPLDPQTLKTIAVIGPYADKVLLDWYSGTPPYRISPLEGIRNYVKDKADVLYAGDNENGAAEKIAVQADVVILCAGNHPTCDNAPWGECKSPGDGREAVDRQTLELDQEDLIRKIYSVNRNMVVVLISSFPYAINWTQANIPAILHMTHASQESGSALADVLFGDYNPGGRLVQTWPAADNQLPPMMDYNIRNGRTYMYFRDEPLYPFGYGLSYTAFAYENMTVDPPELSAGGAITVTVQIRNTGLRAGDEVIQLYIRHFDQGGDFPLMALKGFRRVTLVPGERKKVTLILKGSDLERWHTDRRRFGVEPGDFKLMAGSSSADIRLRRTIRITR